MVFILDKKITGLICVVPFVYFAGLALYTFLPELIGFVGYDSRYWCAFYWVNNSIISAILPFLFSYLLENNLVKLLIMSTSIFLLILSAFQVYETLGFGIDRGVWIIFFSAYIMAALTTYKYERKKSTK